MQRFEHKKTFEPAMQTQRNSFCNNQIGSLPAFEMNTENCNDFIKTNLAEDFNDFTESNLDQKSKHLDTSANNFNDTTGRNSAQTSNNLNLKHRKLANWAVKHKQTRKSVSHLLAILREEDPSLPKDYRTLCATPKLSCNRIVDMGSGKYIHFGLLTCLQQFFLCNDVKNSELLIDINIDGVPIAQSSSSCLRPILVNVVGFKSILVIGIYFGSGKPDDINNYMKHFVEEYLSIFNDGFHIGGKHFSLRVRCVIADAPERAFFLNIKTHTGYLSCHKCKIKGFFSTRRVCFPGVANELRTDEEFFNKIDQSHHRSQQPLIFESIPDFGCVTNVIIDYMHAVLLGVTKKLLLFWTTEKKASFSLRKNEISKISQRITNIGQLLNEFARKPRELIYLRRYKATELRQLLLYTLPVITKGILKPKFYNHFMLFHSAIRILCTPSICVTHNHIAASLLNKFVKHFPRLYGNHQVKFNVHSLLHLPNDVIFTQTPLDSFSSFIFENHLQVLKKESKNCVGVLEQIANRNAEESC